MENAEDDCVNSSGNVFADMGLEDAEALLTRARLGQAVREILQATNPHEIAEWLEINQAEAARLMDGKYQRFSEQQLCGFITRLAGRHTGENNLLNALLDAIPAPRRKAMMQLFDTHRETFEKLAAR